MTKSGVQSTPVKSNVGTGRGRGRAGGRGRASLTQSPQTPRGGAICVAESASESNGASEVGVA